MGWHTGHILTENLPAPLNRFRPDHIDPIRVLIVAVLVLVSLFVWSEARDRLATPFDDLVTERACEAHGEEIGREVTGYERSNRFGVYDRSEGFCRYGPGLEGEAPITLLIADTEPGLEYLAGKWIGIILQLGIVSLFLRLTIDPALDLYRYIRSWFTS